MSCLIIPCRTSAFINSKPVSQRVREKSSLPPCTPARLRAKPSRNAHSRRSIMSCIRGQFSHSRRRSHQPTLRQPARVGRRRSPRRPAFADQPHAASGQNLPGDRRWPQRCRRGWSSGWRSRGPNGELGFFPSSSDVLANTTRVRADGSARGRCECRSR